MLFPELARSDTLSGARIRAGKNRLDRLRDRVLKDQGEELAEEELLELLLASALHRHDVQNLVADLLGRFRSLSGVLSATPEELCRVKGVGEAVAVLVKLVSQFQSPHTRSAQCQESESPTARRRFRASLFSRIFRISRKSKRILARHRGNQPPLPRCPFRHCRPALARAKDPSAPSRT